MLTRLLLLSACALSCAVVPSASAADKPLLVVRGTRTGYVDVTFPATFSLDPYMGVATYRRGTYGGFWAERIGDPATVAPNQFGFVAIGMPDGRHALARTGKSPDPQHDGVSYTAGRYRIHVVTDGRFEVVIPVDSGLSRSILATPKHAAAKATFVSATGMPTAAGTAWDAREAVSVGTGRVAAMSVAFVRWDAAGAHDDLLCFAAPGQECPPATVTQGSMELANGTGQFSTSTVLAAPGSLTRGTYDAVQRTVAAPGTAFTSMRGFALVFDAPAG